MLVIDLDFEAVFYKDSRSIGSLQSSLNMFFPLSRWLDWLDIFKAVLNHPQEFKIGPKMANYVIPPLVVALHI
jgi:hypothetical protein